MAKKIETQENFTGGIDLLTERDLGNDVLILTGKPERSLEFWKKLSDTATSVIFYLEEKIESEKSKSQKI